MYMYSIMQGRTGERREERWGEGEIEERKGHSIHYSEDFTHAYLHACTHYNVPHTTNHRHMCNTLHGSYT